MRKTILKSALLAITGVGLMAGGAMATPLGNGPSLIQTQAEVTAASGQVALETLTTAVFGAGVVDVYNDQSGVGGWVEGESDVSSYLISLGFAAGTGTPQNGIFGVYDLQNSTQKYDLLDTSTDAGASFSFYNGNLLINSTSVSSGWSESFGFYFTQNAISRFTEDDENSDGKNYVATYLLGDGVAWDTGANGGDLTGGNDWLLAFESNAWATGEARDFNDAVFIVEDMDAVPEPATMLLFGTGLAGLAGLRRKKGQKKA